MLRTLTAFRRTPCSPSTTDGDVWSWRELVSPPGRPPRRWEGDSELLLRGETVREKDKTCVSCLGILDIFYTTELLLLQNIFYLLLHTC